MLRQKRSKRGGNLNVVGPQIRELRRSNDKNLVELSADLEMDFGVKLDRSVIGRIERGKRRVFDIELLAFARVFEVEIEDLFPESVTTGSKSEQ